jgi:hypothetical protein
MKKIKFLSLLASLLFLLEFTANAQTTNTFSRNLCSPQFSGCVNTPLTLTLETEGGEFGVSSSKAVNAPSSVTFGTNFTKIKVSLSGVGASTHYYTLPTTIGQSTIIFIGADGEGVGPYSVSIYKSVTNQFMVGVGNTAY